VSKNVLTGLFILLASAFATWLFLPLANAQVEVAPISDTPLVVPIGPLQVNLMLIVLFIAAGTPAAALVMGVLMSWMGSKVPADAAARTSAKAAPARKTADASKVAAGAAVEAELPLAQKLGLLLLMLVAIGVTLVFVVQVLPPGFTLF